MAFLQRFKDGCSCLIRDLYQSMAKFIRRQWAYCLWDKQRQEWEEHIDSEFHSSFNVDHRVLAGLDYHERSLYLAQLMRFRAFAHEKDLAKHQVVN